MTSQDKGLLLLSAPSAGATATASSILQRNGKLYGPLNALDLDNTTTCWNSDGSPSGKQSSHYVLNFGRLVEPVEVKIQFQAGFVGEILNVHWLDGASWKPLSEEEVEDDHNLQSFFLTESCGRVKTKSLKFEFDECTDFYGRVIVYQLQVWGVEADDASGEIAV